MKKQPDPRRTKLYRDVEVLIQREDFKRGVKRIRGEWGIPDNGFENIQEDIQKYAQWLNPLIKERGRRNHYLEFELVWRNGGLRLAHQQMVQALTSSLHSQFLGDMKDLCWELKLSSEWDSFVLSYVLFNRVKRFARILLPRPSIVGREKGGHRRLEFIKLKLGIDTTLEDLKSIWKEVVRLQKEMRGFEKGKRRWKRNLSRDLKWYEKRHTEGKTLSKIWHEEELPDHPSKVANTTVVAKALKRLDKRFKT